jgi:hypothetical protein
MQTPYGYTYQRTWDPICSPLNKLVSVQVTSQAQGRVSFTVPSAYARYRMWFPARVSCLPYRVTVSSAVQIRNLNSSVELALSISSEAARPWRFQNPQVGVQSDWTMSTGVASVRVL